MLKWSRRTKRYSLDFENALTACLDKHPVYIRAISARGDTIESIFDQLLAHLGIARSFTRKSNDASKRIGEIGPLRRIRRDEANPIEIRPDSELTFLTAPEKQAVMAVFICHFLIRTHQNILALQKASQPDLLAIDWQLMPNKFPGDIHGPMSSFLGALMSACGPATIAGSIKTMFFTDAKTDHGNDLADDIAGLLRAKLMQKRGRLQEKLLHISNGKFYWEIWDQVEDAR